MGEQVDFPVSPEAYERDLTPTQTRTADGKEYSQEYSFKRIYFDEGFRDKLSTRAATKFDGDVLYYKYPGKPPVMLTQDKVMGHKGDDRQEAEKQAYHLISMLDAGGYVAGWRQS